MLIFHHILHKNISRHFLLAFIFLMISGPENGYGRSFFDDMGRQVPLASEPKRIVSMAPNITEILFALGLKNQIVGVTNYCNYPAEAANIERIGGFINPSLEKIIFLKPDIILCTADGNRKETVRQLENIGLPVFVVNPVDIDKLFNAILRISEITGRKEEGIILVTQLRDQQQQISAMTKSLSKPRVFFQVGIEPIITVGGETFITKLIDAAGGINIYGHESSRYPRCSIEDIISKNPDIIIISSAGKMADYRHAKKYWQQWSNLQAVQDNRIYRIDPDIINRPSPRIMDALEELTKILHPEVRWSPLKRH